MVVCHVALHKFEWRFLLRCDFIVRRFQLHCSFVNVNSLDKLSVDHFLFKLLFLVGLLFFFVTRVNRFIILSCRFIMKLINLRTLALRLLE